MGNNYINVKYKIYSKSQQWVPQNIEGKPAQETLTGITQAGCYSDIQNQVVVWNAPFECAFKSSTLLDWPQLILTVTAPNMFGKSIIIAYGNVHLPTQPGR